MFFTVQGALPLLRDGAAIVLISSLTSKLGMPGTSAYAGSKAAVRTMARAMAAELPRGIRVNVVTPGYTRTPLWERTRTPQQIAAVNERLPMIVPLERGPNPKKLPAPSCSSLRAIRPTFRARKSSSTAALAISPAAPRLPRLIRWAN